MAMKQRYGFDPVKRFVVPAPVPFLVTEKDLPRHHRILVILPHSDDGRYFGSTLYLMNKRNRIKVIIMSPGYHGVDMDLTVEQKIRLRWTEALRWARTLGLKKSQMVNFRADRTYNTQQINDGELDRLRRLIRRESPTMVFIPHLSDTAQAINHNARAMVVESLLGWIEKVHNRNPRHYRPVIIVEYPTNHVPILPPSDKNFVIFFTRPEATALRREANLEHRSQSPACFDITEKLVEALHAISEADTLHYLHKRRQVAECISGITVDPRTSRGEHFGVTLMRVKGDPPAVVEERIVFPLSAGNLRIWNPRLTPAPR
jgi:LmbE family N-acetylglucosaminyl deacetylase